MRSYDYLALNQTESPGRTFEDFVAALLGELGCTIRYTGAVGTSEQGADFVALRFTKLFPFTPRQFKWGVQVKCTRTLKRDITDQLRRIRLDRGICNILIVAACDPDDGVVQHLQNWARENQVCHLEIWGRLDLDSLVQRFPAVQKFFDAPTEEGSVENRLVADRYYYAFGCVARAIRLVGTSDECFKPEDITVTAARDPYVVPDEFRVLYASTLDHLNREAEQHGRLFFDGPQARLVRYRVMAEPHSERKSLRLTLGPVGWFDYSVVHRIFAEKVATLTLERLRHIVDLKRIVESGSSIDDVRLTNILCCAVTVITVDGQIWYSRRSMVTSMIPGWLTSCVAENIHESKDEIFAHEPTRLPVPFRTVQRGVSEELSEDLLGLQHSIWLLGLCFGLGEWEYHPALCFLVVLDATEDEVRRRVRENPGKDFIEGSADCCPLYSYSAMRELLKNPNWVPGGKASFLRAAEFVTAAQKRADCQLDALLKGLSRGELPKMGS